MKERLACLLSEIGESFDYLKSDIRNLSRYMAQLEDLLERDRAFVSTATLTTSADQAELRKLLKKTQKVIGPPPDKPEDVDDRETEKAAPGNEAGPSKPYMTFIGSASPPVASKQENV